MDYELQSQLLINALKEAEGQRAVRMPEAKMQGNYAILPGAGNTLDAGFNRILGNFQKRRVEQQMADLRGQERGDYDRLLKELTTPGMKQVQDNSSAMGPLPEPVTRNAPLSPLEESQRRLSVYGQMSRLPMAKAMADKGIASEVDFPEKQAMREQQIAANTELARQRAEDQFRSDRARAEDRNDQIAQQGALRMTLAQMAASNQGSNNDLKRQLLEAQIAAAGEKGAAAKAKQESAANAVKEGRDNVTMLLDNMSADVNDLNNAGGIVSNKRNVWDNMSSRLQGSTVGQFLGGATGTKEQTLRDNLEASRGQLLLELKNAKNLPAAMMNSNMELQRQLKNLGEGPISYETYNQIIKNARTLLNAHYQNTAAGEGVSLGGTAPRTEGTGTRETSGAIGGVKPPAADVANFESYYNSLPPGTRYITPDGRPKIKGQR